MKYTIEYTEDDRSAMLCSIHWLEISVTVGNVWDELGSIANTNAIDSDVEKRIRDQCSVLYELLEIIEHR